LKIGGKRMEAENTGYGHLLDELDKDEGFETPKVKAIIDGFWGGKETEAGDEIRGIFLERRTFQGRNNKNFNSILLLTKEGVYGVTENKFLESRLENIKEGDGLKLKYTGKTATKDNQNEYKTYDVMIKKFQPDLEKKGNTNGFMKTVDDPEARNFVDHVKYEMTEKKMVTDPESIIQYVTQNKKDLEINDEHILRVKKILADEIKECK
jgi:hypothetical protein